MIKLLVTDVDGTLTDGTVEYRSDGTYSRRFSVIDGKGISSLKEYDIRTVMITSSAGEDIRLRARKLKIDVFTLVENKVKTIERICKDMGIGWSEVAAIGDDINDFKMLSYAVLPACPCNAHDLIKNIPGIIKLAHKGGNGAVREFIDNYILQ